jgi:hypothetical protein
MTNYETTNEPGNNMTTTDARLILWSANLNEAGQTISYRAVGSGFDALVFTKPFGVEGWHASVKLAGGETLTTLGRPSSNAAKAWCRIVVNEYT